MTGNINWAQTDRGLTWGFNTDAAYIKFYNTGDGDTDSRLEYGTSDNGDEYHRFTIAGNERFTIKNDAARFNNNVVWHQGNLTNLNQLSNGPGYVTGGPYIPVSANTNATGWISFSASTQGTPIIKAIQQDTSAGYYLFQGVTGSTEVFRVDRSGGAYFASTIQTDGNIYISNNGGRLYFDRPNGATVGAVGWHTNDVFYLGGHPDYGPGAGNAVRVYGFGGDLSFGSANAGDVITINNSGTINTNYTIISSGGSGTTPTLVLNRNIATPSNYYNGLQLEIRATSGTAGIGLHRNGYSHVGIYHDAANSLKFDMNAGTVTLNHNTGTVWGTGNLTNLNQLSNGPGYITGYTETDTLATVVSRGSTTSGSISIGGNLTVSSNNTTGGGIILADDGDIVDLNDAFCSMRFTSGVRIFSANRGGSAVITLGSNGTITASAATIGGSSVVTNNGGTWGINVTGTANSETLATVTSRGGTTSSAIDVQNRVYSRASQSDNNYTTAALWTQSFNNTTTGIAFHISGNVGKFLEMRTNGILYWENAQVWTSSNLTNLNQLSNGPGYITSSALSGYATRQDGTRFTTNYNSILSSGFYNGEGQPSNAPNSFGQLIVAKGIDTGLQIAGGYSSQQLYFRGWGYGPEADGFYPWRRLLNSGADPYAADMNQYVRTTDDVTHAILRTSNYIVSALIYSGGGNVNFGNNIGLNGNNAQIQFNAAASADLFISAIPGTRTVEIRNGNAGSPNYGACGLITGTGSFTSTISVGNSSEVLGLIQMGSSGRYGMGVSSAYTSVYGHNSGNGVRLGYYDGTTFYPRMTIPNSGAPLIDSNAILHAGNYNSYSPTLTGGNASGTWSINITGGAGSANLASNSNALGGWSLQQVVPFHSGSDFPNGTLVVTSINASVTYGDSFVMEVTGKSYGSGPAPFGLLLEGYIYADTYINVGAISYGSWFPGPIKILNYNGNLAFWWPRGSYWNSFSVTVREAGGSSLNRVTSISDSTEPSSSKKVSVTPSQALNSSNYNSYAPTLTGGGASGSWNINAASVGGRTVGTSTDNIPFLGGTRNLVINNPENYSGEVRLGAAWDRGGVYASNVLTLGTSSGSIDFVHSNSLTARLVGNSGNYGPTLMLGTTNPAYTLIDANYRPVIYLHGQYPVLTLNHTVTGNGSHGPTIQFTHDTADRQWVIGSNGSGTRLDFGYSTYTANRNPHNGIDEYNGSTIMRISNDNYVTIKNLTVSGVTNLNGTVNAYAGELNVNRINFRTTGGSATSDPYCIRWIDENSARGNGLSWLEFQLNDDSNEEIRIYGNSCAGYSCGAISDNLYHRFRADGYAWHGGNLSVGGAITAGGDITAFSDSRIKENVEVIKDALEKVQGIRGVTFTRNDSIDKAKRHTGVIAQEVLTVLPEVVNQDQDTGLYNVAYGNMVGLLVEAIKEQQTHIDAQKSEIEELKELVKQLINK